MPEFVPAEAFPPGEFLKEEIDDRGWTQQDLADILGRPHRLVNEIIAAKRAITPETATGLAEAFGTSAAYWMNLETAWQLYQSRKSSPPNGGVARKADLYSRFPVRDMLKRNWIAPFGTAAELEAGLRSFYGTSDLDAVGEIPHAARRVESAGKKMLQTSWVYRVRQLAATLETGHFSKTGLDRAFKKLGNLLRKPEDASGVASILSEAGIRFVIVEQVPGSRIDGVCCWLDRRTPVVGMSLRYDRMDYFWFTLMHELVHVRHGHGLDVPVVDSDVMGAHAGGGPQERLANEEGADLILPASAIKPFIKANRPYYSLNKIEALAQRHGLHSSLVLGQLQYRGEVGYGVGRRLHEKILAHVISTAMADGWGVVSRAR